MDGRKVVVATAMLLALGAPAAYAAPGVTVSQVSSLKGTSGTLTGTVVNETSQPASRKLTVHLLRRGTKRALVGSTPVKVAARGKTNYRVNVKLPGGLAKGTYYLAACTPYNANDGRYGCATAHEDVLIGGGSRVRPPLARASQAETCSSGARTLSKPGTRVYPETGNGGYLSLHTDVYNVYDAVANLFLPGNHVDLTQRSTQCLTDFSLDFERSNTNATAGPEHDRERGQDQRPAGQLPLRPADLPRRPERAGRPGPARASGQPDQPGRRRRRQPAPARLHAARHGRRAAGPAVPGDQARDHAQRADPERHRVQGHRLLHRPPRRAHRRRRLHRGLVPQQQPGRRRLLRDHRAARDDGLDAAQQPPDGQADLRLL